MPVRELEANLVLRDRDCLAIADRGDACRVSPWLRPTQICMSPAELGRAHYFLGLVFLSSLGN